MSLLTRKPLWVLWILAGAVALAEAAAMVAIDRPAFSAAPWVIAADASLLGIFLVPVLYYLVVRPSRAQVAALEEEVERRAAAERDLEEKNRLNKLLVDSLPHPAWLIDRDRNVLLQNRAGLELRPESGGHCWKGVPAMVGAAGSEGTCPFCRADEALASGETQTSAIELDGRTWDAYWVPVDLRAGTYLHYAVDVTARLRAAEEERRAREQAEEASRTKSNFLAMMSHEIRTPMNGVLGMIDLALDTGVTEEQREYLDLARSSAEALLRVIGDVLDFSKVEAGKMEFEALPFDLQAMVEGAAGTVAYLARDKGLDLRAELEPGLPRTVTGDAGRLRQVLLNLLGNALKFTERGEVTVHVERTGSRAENLVLFCVRDTGPGIPADKRDRLFKSFSQVDASATRRHGGTGLGLAISKQIVENMGGRIWAESREGAGSTFFFTVPLDAVPQAGESAAAEATQADPAAQPFPSRKLKVLLVEDNPVNQRLVTLLLEKRGDSVAVAGNGLEALNAFAPGRFDVILMDVQMPVLGGLEATRALRGKEGKAGHTPVIGLTAMATRADQQACLDAGMDEYLAKPIKAAALFATIDRVLGGPASSPAPTPAPERKGDPADELAHEGADGPTDLADLTESLDGDEEALREIVEHFVGETGQRLETLRRAIATGDRAEVGKIAHTIRGSVALFGATEAAEAALRLEAAGGNGPAGLEAPLADLESELHRVTEALRARTSPGSGAAAGHGVAAPHPVP